MITKRIVAPPRRLQEAATALAVSAGEKGDEDGGGDQRGSERPEN